MKYKIDGIENSRIIKNIKVVNNNVIEVKYLDGNKDIIECNEDNLTKIKDIMTEQAKKYVDKNKKCIVGFNVIAICVAILSLICFLTAIIKSGVISTPICLVLSILLAQISLEEIKEAKYLKKYDLYLEENFKQELDKYKAVMRKEKSLGKKLSKKEQKQVALTDITCLDKYSLEELKAIREKVSRYTSLVGDNMEFPVLEEEKVKQKVKK